MKCKSTGWVTKKASIICYLTGGVARRATGTKLKIVYFPKMSRQPELVDEIRGNKIEISKFRAAILIL